MLVDGGIGRGTDAVKALCLGAKGVRYVQFGADISYLVLN